MPLWRLRGQNPPLRAEGVAVVEGTGADVRVVTVTAAYPIPATAQKTQMNRRVVVLAVYAEVVPVVSTLRRAPSVVGK
jgi:hypothetical protein